MPKSKYSAEFRTKVSQEYLDGIGSIRFFDEKKEKRKKKKALKPYDFNTS